MAREGAPSSKGQEKPLDNLRAPDFSIQYWSEVTDSLLWLFELTRVNQNFIEECTDPILLEIADFLKNLFEKSKFISESCYFTGKCPQNRLILSLK